MNRSLHFCLVTAAALAVGAVFAKPPSLEEGRKHWAFQPLNKSPLPVVKDAAWPRNEVDRYILAALEAKGLKPAPEADRATLIRRVTLDLTGLLPTPEEVEAFVKNDAPDAYERVVDGLLKSPHYGERWGRHWLDLARYADTGGFHNDLERPYAWKYRDYVIQSFNDDKPYARFVAEQLAGDEVDGADEQSLIATGFCRNGPSNDDNMGKTKEAIAQYKADQMDDVISTTSSVFLGLTLGCARCHDHKTDPLLARDYYSLYAVFNGTEPLGLGKGAKDKNDKEVKLTSKVMALMEKTPEVPNTHVLLRGLAASPGEEVHPAVPVVLTSGSAVDFQSKRANTSGRRLTLAQWITSPDNALTWRVLANRMWQHHFGVGIVASPSNFGFTGARPTHPELLDYLAAKLIANGGHLKPLHRELVLSATYRQQRTGQTEVQPLRFANLQRMEAEVIRDSVLVAGGNLNPKVGGPGIKPRIRADLLDASQRNKWPAIRNEGPEQWRRSVYIYVKRQLLMPSMELFDAPTTTDSCAMRVQSTVPTQALVMMNDDFVEEQAAYLAKRVKSEAGDDLKAQIRRLFMITLSRWPTESRLSESSDFLATHELKDLAHVLLNSSEFVTVE